MLRFIIITLLVAAVSSQPEGRIVGGEVGNIRQFPYQVSLRVVLALQCGASVIGPRWVLSAAHCVIKAQAEDVTFRAGSSMFYSGGIIVQADKIFIHPEFNYDTTENDVAVISTKTDLVGKNIVPIKLPEAGAPLPFGQYMTVSGWGRTVEDGPVSTIIKFTKLKILEQNKCAEAYKHSVITDVMFCAAEPGTDSCQGDSGGPAVVDSVQYGVVSWGHGCARQGKPGVFTRISDPKIRNWIKSTTSI